MDISKIGIFKSGLFKKVKYLASTQHDAQPCVFLGEIGVASLEYLPTETGLMFSDDVKMSWDALHVRKVRWPGIDDPVFVLSPRSRYSLDPYNLHPLSKENEISQDVIANLKYTEAEARLRDKRNVNPNTKLLELIIWVVGIITAISIVVAFVSSRTG